MPEIALRGPANLQTRVPLVKTQNLESVTSAVEKLEKVLASHKNGHGAQYWFLLEVKCVWETECGGEESVYF